MRRAARYLSVGGGALAVLVMSVVHARWIADPPYPITGTFRFTWMVSYIALISIATYAVGLPDQPRNKRQAAWLALLSTAVGAGGISMVQLLVGDALLPRFVVFGAALLNVPVQVAVNALARDGRSRAEERDRVLLIASPAERERLIDDLRMEPERAASLVATMSPVEASSTEGSGAKTFGAEASDVETRSTHAGWAPVLELQRASMATLIVLDHDAQADDQVIAQAAKLHESGIRVRTLQGFYEEWLGKLPLNELERASLFFDIGEIHRTQYSRIKRVIDVAVSLVGLVALAVITPVVFLANLVANKGPLIYRQTRVGKGGGQFTILKFRTMGDISLDAGTRIADGEWTTENDPRITPFGRLLRRSHLDELPQMINILKGDLSVVGPRPEQPRYVEELSDKLAFYDLRHLVRPGLTGWAQVKYGYAGDERDALEKLQYEFFYLRRQNLSFDLRIMLRTMRSMVGGSGTGR